MARLKRRKAGGSGSARISSQRPKRMSTCSLVGMKASAISTCPVRNRGWIWCSSPVAASRAAWKRPSMMEGRFQAALDAATGLEHQIQPRFLTGHVEIADAFMPTKLHVLIRFGRWEEILAEPEPPAFRRFSRAMRHYARGVAYS